MGIKIFTCDHGTIEYRIPEVKEGISLMKTFSCFVGSDASDPIVALNQMDILADMIPKYIINVNIINDGCSFKSCEDLLGDIRNVPIIMALSNNMMELFNMNDKKKVG